MLKSRTQWVTGAILFLSLNACGSYKGEWPRLSPNDDNDIEFQQQTALDQATRESAEEVNNTPQISDRESAARLAQLTSRLNQARANFSNLERRYSTQSTIVEGARQKARSGRLGPSSTDWTTTQLELTRLGQITSEIVDLRAAVAQISADIAALAAQGGQVQDTLIQAGNLVARIDTAISNAEVYRREVNMSLSDSPRP